MATLLPEELNLITHLVERLASKTPEETEKLIYEWTKTGHLTRLEHVLLCRWHYGSQP